MSDPDQVLDQVADQVLDQTADQVLDQVTDQVLDQVLDQSVIKDKSVGLCLVIDPREQDVSWIQKEWLMVCNVNVKQKLPINSWILDCRLGERVTIKSAKFKPAKASQHMLVPIIYAEEWIDFEVRLHSSEACPSFKDDPDLYNICSDICIQSQNRLQLAPKLPSVYLNQPVKNESFLTTACWYGHYLAGTKALEFGLIDLAIDHFEQAQQMNPQRVEPCYGLRRAYIAKNDPDKARESLRAMEQNSENDEIFPMLYPVYRELQLRFQYAPPSNLIKST